MAATEAISHEQNFGPFVPAFDRRLRAGDPLHVAAVDFLSEEAWRLDDYDLSGWLELLDPDLSYDVPVRTTITRSRGAGFSGMVGHYADDFVSVERRVRRLSTSRAAWAEDPSSRTRRIVSSVICHASSDDRMIDVRSALAVSRSRIDQYVPEIITAERRDVLRLGPAGFRLLRRTVLLDQTVLGTPNLAIFL